MRLDEIKYREIEKNAIKLVEIEKYAHTLAFQRKLNQALQVLDVFFSQAGNPVISCGGGKDGTAVAILATQVNPLVKIICANPPNPLPDRKIHLENLKQYLDGQWSEIDYKWDVRAVLEGRAAYPYNMKQRVLTQWAQENDIDGVIMGIRNAESRARTINFAKNGYIYQTKSGLRCQPIAKWTWQEVICLSLLFGAPINPVYEKMSGIPNLDYLHDGTWWAHGFGDKAGWIKRYYPEHYDDYLRSSIISDKKLFSDCEW